MSMLKKLGGLIGGDKAEGTESSGLLSGLFGHLFGEKTSGLKSLVEKFQGAGLKDIVGSWVGKGENLPVSADQIKSALGNDQLAGLAARMGVPQESVSEMLAKYLPGAVDKMTPDGVVPETSANA